MALSTMVSAFVGTASPRLLPALSTAAYRRMATQSAGPGLVTIGITGTGAGCSVDVVNGEQPPKTFLVDQPVAKGGKGKGANPLEHFLGGLVGCSQSLLTWVASERNLPLGKTHWQASAKFDMNGVMGVPGASAHLKDFKLVCEVECSHDQTTLDSLAREVEQRCIVAATVRKTGEAYDFKLLPRKAN